ncbi:ABC transporter permease [Zavarzinia compransoris]|uniref:ABC transporter permease n=1 Tax=Zavarzinia marina TaxID=2911065 RepID=UPI001F2428C6|nr:ABC transporter permease [Zavarzinia marina]MCF4167308.1 ABC transporter permease [Zavarzinia marina]
MSRALRQFFRIPPTALLGMAVVLGYAVVALFAHWIAPFGESEIVSSQYDPWGGAFLLGTDNIGRDMFSRLIYGARNTIGIALLITALSFSVGGLLGLFAAVRGGWVDMVLSWIVDILMAIPQLIYALLLLTIFGTSIPVLIAVVAVLDSTRVFRLARSVGMNVVVLDFVEAARLRGESLWWIVRREVLPNVLPPLIAEFGVRFCFVFLFISALSFLGIGIQPPLADWGSMVRDNATLITFGDVTPVLPGLAIAILTVAVNFVVDWVLGKASGAKS